MSSGKKEMELGEIKIAHEDYEEIVDEGRYVADGDKHIYFQIGLMNRLTSSTTEGCIRQTLGIPVVKRIIYSKIKVEADTPSRHIGKWRIQFEDGSPINPDALNWSFSKDAWPSYPLVVDDEEEAAIYAKSWEDYLHALG